MTAAALVLVAVAGGVGAVLRLLVDTAVTAARARRRARSFPLGTVVVNVSGSFAIGVVAGLTVAAAVPAEVTALLATGLLGGYTTFSAASVDAVRLAQDGRRTAAAVYAVGLVAASAIAAALGLVLTTSVLAVL
jgi:CrcB protein